ncbi:hypothetical protein [Frateuria aurantia]|uniref:Uncharacterized protein n=1 Tax=Frateuria aurantia (strain ATCC 33424 / DSM 6220 / KCTC 2777 / LMG 1558 / NBRC 3245 / NCIMB 13370) TaxID=767434 RepID=H8L1W1_FRAAD|nr:hypothetical protein [Frateuria aurantia]AFC86372.1 hypothetical protein Fraau_1985 [Frateuria aurantia DSM 6220]
MSGCSTEPCKHMTPSGHAYQIIESVAGSLIDLGFYDDDESFQRELLSKLVDVCCQGVTAAGLDKYHEKVLAMPESEQPEGPIHYGVISLMRCIYALRSDRFGNSTEAWNYVIEARFYADAILSQRCDVHAVKQSRTAVAKSGSKARHESSPHAEVKPLVRSAWAEWRGGAVSYRSTAAFCRDVVKQYPVIADPRTVARWVAEWDGQ